jgi:hypothetical protein
MGERMIRTTMRYRFKLNFIPQDSPKSILLSGETLFFWQHFQQTALSVNPWDQLTQKKALVVE